MPVMPFDRHEPELGKAIFIAPGAYVIGDVKIGNRSSIWFNAVIRGDMENITIGEESNLQDNVTVHVDANAPTRVGNRVTVGHNAVLHGCTVEDGCLIGMGAVILNGALIGKDSLVAAGSLVTPNTTIPPRSLVIGSPGKVVKTLEEDKVPVKAEMYRSYLHLAEKYLDAKPG